jgi:hypothetical protein
VDFEEEFLLERSFEWCLDGRGMEEGMEVEIGLKDESGKAGVIGAIVG